MTSFVLPALETQAQAIAAAIENVTVSSAPARIETALDSDRAATLGIFRLQPVGNERLWQIAIHESGHAVVAQSLGVAMLRVEMRADGSGRSECDHGGRNGIGDRLNGVIQLLAGHIAESYVNPNALSPYRLVGSFDVLQARQDLDSMAADHPGFMNALSAAQLATAAVSSQWDAIYRVAAQLRKHGSLSGDEVRQLIADA